MSAPPSSLPFASRLADLRRRLAATPTGGKTTTLEASPELRALVALGPAVLPDLRQHLEAENGLLGYLLALAAIEMADWPRTDFHPHALGLVREQVLERLQSITP